MDHAKIIHQILSLLCYDLILSIVLYPILLTDIIVFLVHFLKELSPFALGFFPTF